jgi:hypothetical protein
MRTARIPYNTIERVWHQNLLWGTTYLCMATKNGRFDIFSGMFSDAPSFVAVAKFLNARAHQSEESATRLLNN